MPCDQKPCQPDVSSWVTTVVPRASAERPPGSRCVVHEARDATRAQRVIATESHARGQSVLVDLPVFQTSVLLPLAGLAEQVKAGQLRALASTTKSRTEMLQDVPTVAELGHKEYEADFWNGLLAPARTPKETVSQLSEWFIAALQVPEVKAKLIAQGFSPVGLCGADYGSLLRKQHDEFGRLIHEANTKAD
jgi:Tripartite tricarboxylate transporter family receptor